MRWFDIIAFVCKAPKVHEACEARRRLRYVFSIKHGGLTLTNFVVFYCFTSWCLTIWYFIFVYLILVSLIVLYFLHNTSVLSFYLNVVLILSIAALAPNAPKLQEAVKKTASGPLLVFCKYYKLYIQQIWERSHLYLGRDGS